MLKPNHYIGVGINYRSEIADDLINNLSNFDFIEINPERFFGTDINEKLTTITKTLPVVLHGLTLSLGSMSEDISETYIANLTATLQKIDCEWYSEHLATTKVRNIELRTLMPVEFNNKSVDDIVKKVKKIMSLSDKPFLLENITYYYTMPNSNLTELEFINNVCTFADCGILLDLNNLYVNSINHKYDPFEFINKLPLDRVVEVHLAGCSYIHNMLVDTHASRVRNEVLDLLKHLYKKIKANGIVIERDDKLHNFQDLIDEVFLIKEIIK